MYTAESNVQFAICIADEEDGDLEVWKVYRVLPDLKASAIGCLRVIDKSGEDYLYPQGRFIVVELPEEARERLLAAIEKSEQLSNASQ
jgi:hypothetical protein